jgi:hypothetical protein
MHEIERAADESTSGCEDGQCAHRCNKQAKPSPLNVSTAYLLNIFFGPASTIPWRAVGRRSDRRRQRFNGSRHGKLNVKCLDAITFPEGADPPSCTSVLSSVKVL